MENIRLKQFLSILIDKKLTTEVFYKTLLVFMIKEGMINQWLKYHPNFEQVLLKLREDEIVTIVNDRIALNKINYERSRYPVFLGLEEVMSFSTLLYKFKQKWKGKKGIGANDRIYLLLDNNKTSHALTEFLKLNKDIDYETILEATEEYLNEKEQDEAGNYIFGVKSNTFITGNENNQYLIEYCKNLQRRKDLQTNLKGKENFGSHGRTNWQDV